MSRGWQSTAVRTGLVFYRKITEQAGSYLKEGLESSVLKLDTVREMK